MTTLEDLQQRVRQQVLGYTRDQQQMSELSAPMSPTDTIFTLESETARNISRGLVEIGDELILVKTVDQATKVAAVLGLTNGRGREGTTAAAHSATDLVTMSPAMPRQRVKEAINDAIKAMYPACPQFATTDISKLAPVFEYGLPAAAMGVWYVVADTVGPTQVHYPAPRWRYNPKADTTDFPTGKSIQLLDYVTPGRAMRVVYTIQPTVLVNASDAFSVTGYDERLVETVIWGACARLIPAYETARLQQMAIEGTERANLVPAQAAVRTAAYYETLFQQSLQRERDRILEETPNYAFWQGG